MSKNNPPVEVVQVTEGSSNGARPNRNRQKGSRYQVVFNHGQAIAAWKWLLVSFVITLALKYLPFISTPFEGTPLYVLGLVVLIVTFTLDNVLGLTCWVSDYCDRRPIRTWSLWSLSRQGWSIIVLALVCSILAFHLLYQHADLNWEFDFWGFLGFQNGSPFEAPATSPDSSEYKAEIEDLKRLLKETSDQNRALLSLVQEYEKNSGDNPAKINIEVPSSDGSDTKVIASQKCWIKDPRTPSTCNTDLPCMLNTNASLGIYHQKADCTHDKAP